MTSNIHWATLSGEDLSDALQGVYDPKPENRRSPWLNSIKLRYYQGRSCLLRGKDERVLFMAYVDAADNMKTAVGLLEIDYTGPGEVGLHYVTVAPEYHRKGLAGNLYKMLIAHLKANGLKLYRSRPGAKTPAEFTQFVSKLLDKEGIEWRVSEY